MFDLQHSRKDAMTPPAPDLKPDEEVERLLERIAEQQSVETAYAMEEASDEEMFTATAAVYRAASRVRAAFKP